MYPPIETIQYFLIVLSGIIVGFTLGLIGGGGSILAIPLLIYLVGYDHPHLVIGTTALAVGVNAYLNLIPHAREGHTDFRTGVKFTIPGLIGVLTGAQLSLITPGRELLFLFAILMLIISALLFKKSGSSNEKEKKTRRSGNAIKLTVSGLVVGFAAGYFGIGGGFLIVPALIYSAGLGIVEAIGTSLVAVGSFGVLTAFRYSISGDLNLIISGLFIVGGIFGGWGGARLSSMINRRTLTRIFSLVIAAVAFYMIFRTATNL